MKVRTPIYMLDAHINHTSQPQVQSTYGTMETFSWSTIYGVECLRMSWGAYIGV